MSETQIYIGSNLVDLYDNQLVTITKKSFDVNNITERSVTFSNSFKAPWTENNAKLFGFAFNQNSKSSLPYKLQQCKVVQNGVETMPDALLYITSPSKKQFNISLLDKSFNLFNEIQEMSLSEIDPIPASSWNASGIDSVRANTSGIVSAVVGWGKYDIPGTEIYNVNYFLPCFFYHTIITSILEFTGLTLSGNILTDSRFKDLVISFSGEFLYPQGFIDPVKGRVNLSNAEVQTGITTGVDIVLTFDDIKWGEDNFPISPTQYVFPFECNATITVPVTLTIDALNDGTTVTAFLRKNFVTNIDSVTFTTVLVTTNTLSFTGNFNPGDIIDVIFNTDAPVIGMDFTVANNSTYMDVMPNRTINRDKVFWNQLWGDIKCIDLLRDFFTRFFIIPSQVGNTLYLKTMSEICSDRANVLDWSNKLVNTDDEPINVSLSYARSNYFKYNGDDDTLGRGSIEIDNDVIEISKELFTSVFRNSVTNLIVFGWVAADIPVYKDDSTGIDDMDEVPELMLFTLKPHGVEPAITFDSIARTDYKIGYFVDSTQIKDTGMQYFIDQFYSEFRSALQLSKVIKKHYNINEIDVKFYTGQNMIWDGYGYFISNSINKFIPDKITDVEVFKIV